MMSEFGWREKSGMGWSDKVCIAFGYTKDVFKWEHKKDDSNNYDRVLERILFWITKIFKFNDIYLYISRSFLYTGKNENYVSVCT